MNNTVIFKRLYNQYTSKFIIKIILAALLSVLVAVSTSATAWLLDHKGSHCFPSEGYQFAIEDPQRSDWEMNHQFN